uniref:Uncharacterized protein n=1 Tax=Hordeum vulgare subsp. vulgare TaxID=112509 RepID=A0A8I6X128_HORVV
MLQQTGSLATVSSPQKATTVPLDKKDRGEEKKKSNTTVYTVQEPYLPVPVVCAPTSSLHMSIFLHTKLSSSLQKKKGAKVAHMQKESSTLMFINSTRGAKALFNGENGQNLTLFF